MKFWKNSASIIILTRRPDKISTNNVRILLQKRSSKTKAYPDSMVFPGGIVDDCDFGKHWIDYYESFGFNNKCFEVFERPNVNLHNISLEGHNSIDRQVSLRITAIRETFEELGILIGKQRNTTVKDCGKPWAQTISNFNVKSWQKEITLDPSKFFTLCKELDCYPDIWSIYLWSNWLTPVKINSPRFNTIFFILAFKEEPSICIEENEVKSTMWESAKNILDAYNKKEITLAFPQFYELSRLQHQENIEDLIEFASKRSCYGCDLFYPVRQRVADGVISLLPGDEFYPINPDFLQASKVFDEKKSLDELRSVAHTTHRVEMSNENMEVKIKNFTPPHFHLSANNSFIPNIPICD